MHKIAVILLNWNGKNFLKQFLPSLIEKTKGENIQFYIVDNGSVDNSIDFVKNTFPFIKIIELQKNYGYAGGYAIALKKINADYFVLINTDVEVTDNWLAPIIELMEKDKHIAACMPKILSYYNKEYFEYAGAAGGFIDVLGYPFCRGRILNVVEKDEGQYDEIIKVFWASGACLIIRSSVYFEAGEFDPLFFAHMEEIDLCWRILTLNYKIVCYSKSFVYHVGGGTLPVNSFKIYLNFRNSLFMLAKNLPTKFYFLIFIRILLDIFSAFIFLLNGKLKFFYSVFKAHIDFFKSSKIIIKHRKNFYRKNNINPILPNIILNQSILLNYFIYNKKKFYLLNKKFKDKIKY